MSEFLDVIPIIILLLIIIISLVSIPFGLPGLVIIAIGLIGYEVLVSGVQFSLAALVTVSVTALSSEGFDYWLTSRMTSRAGASWRGSWGAILGGITGAIVGLPIPIIGSILGSLVGLLVGAYLAERLGARSHAQAIRIGRAALASRLLSTALKFSLGIGIVAWVMLTIF